MHQTSAVFLCGLAHTSAKAAQRSHRETRRPAKATSMPHSRQQRATCKTFQRVYSAILSNNVPKRELQINRWSLRIAPQPQDRRQSQCSRTYVLNVHETSRRYIHHATKRRIASVIRRFLPERDEGTLRQGRVYHRALVPYPSQETPTARVIHEV